jgi:hypothetical protein
MSLSSRVYGFALALCSAFALAGVGFVLPASAGAYATAGSAPVPGSPGLPDGRVYEEVSPANKNGNQAAQEDQFLGIGGKIWAAADGNSAAFESSGPMGDAPSGVELYTVARRSAGGWESYGATPRPQGGFQVIVALQPSAIGFSADFTKSIFQAFAPFVPGEPDPEHAGIFNGYVYDIGTGPTAWLGKPLISNPVSGVTGYGTSSPQNGLIVGASSDLSTVYFSFYGTLTPEDNVLNVSLGDVSRAQVIEREGGDGRGGVGFYEWHEGRLSSAGVLPDGSLDPYGAQPAGQPPVVGATLDPENAQNQVSEDGSRAFFVSPDSNSNHPAGDVPELYVRETAADGTQSTVLVSRDTLLPAVNGLPAAAPHGPSPFESPNTSPEGPMSYVWATPDGSRAFFLSTDQLTAEAPADSSGKLYEFNLDTNTLTYLSGATPPTTNPEKAPGAAMLAASQDGSRLLFVKLVPEPNYHFMIPTELDLWTDGPEGPRGGQITPIASLESGSGRSFLYTRAAGDGSSFVFETNEAFPGFHFNNGGGLFDQIYRYDVAASSLSCLSCPPAGVTPSGDAQLSTTNVSKGETGPTLLAKDRGISEDGDRVFFDTPDPLVPWDTNTAPPVAGSGGLRHRGYDVYEWENGRLFLISTGKSEQNSFVGDNSASGNDVFFSTAEGLVPGDTDGGYDVYDARIPRPGDNLPPQAVPCQGDVCQGPPSAPSLLGAPTSATFSGLGNPAPAVSKPATKQAPKSLTNAQKLSAALKACKKQPKKKRTRCKSQARKKYAPKAKKSDRRGR